MRSYPVVGMRDISEAVGILPGSLYLHIRKKEDILLRIVERGIRNYLDVIEAEVQSAGQAPRCHRRVHAGPGRHSPADPGGVSPVDVPEPAGAAWPVTCCPW